MQIETFKIFRDLVETGSFSKAAELNAITQSAVSQQIRALEKRFKTALIRRRKKNFSITPEGKALLQASQEILRTYETLGDRLEELKNHVSGNLIIATVHSIGLHELPRSLKLFRRSYPSVDVSVEYLRSAQVYQSVAAGTSDVGLVAYPARHRGVTVESHWKDKLVLICPPNHRLAKRHSIEISALSGELFISFAFDQPTRKAIDRIFRANSVTIRRSMEFDNIETVKRAVEIENGIAIVPLASVDEETENGGLYAVEIESVDMWRPIGLVQRRGEPSAAVRAFVSLLRKRDVL
ncbi:MAG: LysR family transcriptional regulator [Verrucomicrobia bacterium]|nr:LysR family transcriptional regulator [Verrucomicrobiota bacterium]